jgi:hypothetical protein
MLQNITETFTLVIYNTYVYTYIHIAIRAMATIQIGKNMKVTS